MAPSAWIWLHGLLVSAPLAASAHGATASVSPEATATTSWRPLFTVSNDATEGMTLLPNTKDPEAIDVQTVCPGYQASNVRESPIGVTADLTLGGSACNVYGDDVTDLVLTVEYQTSSRLRVNIQPAYIASDNSSWFILPTEYIPDAPQEGGSADYSDLTFAWSNDPTFSFNVTRKSTGDVLFTTQGAVLVFENQFIEFVIFEEANYHIYGLGEVIHGFRLGNNFTRTIYAADVGDPVDGNIYGSHPFYLQTRYFEVADDGSKTLFTGNIANPESIYSSYSHGVYMRNAHGQEILMRAENITWRTIGGSIDLYFFAGPSQPEVTKQYLDVIGYPVLQQYFVFGFHQCKWGYENWTVLQSVVDEYVKFDIALETLWTDLDYMNQYRDFDNSQATFSYAAGKIFLDKLHAGGRYYVPIVDSAIYVPNPLNESDSYPTFDRGNDTGSFLLNPDGSLYIGEVWPGYTVFPDWLASSSGSWWTGEFTRWHDLVAFDGAWIDMSEVASFCVGSCGSGNVTMNPVHPNFGLPGEPGHIVYDYPEGFNLTNATEAASASRGASSQSAAAFASASASATLANSSATPAHTSATVTAASTSYLRTTPTPGARNINYPPYVLNHILGDLAAHAVSPNATHHNGVPEYDVHNLFGHQILQNTYTALKAVFPGQRPFIIGRATFAGSGNYSGHWGGDNASKWYYMYFGIPQALSFSLFGIPMFGVDTCGFNGNTDEELCARWMQLSAFFPFYRNHNTLGAIPQEAYQWASVIASTRKAMEVRFALLPYMYTLFYHAHTEASTVMRALAWEFPGDPSLAGADRQFFLGSDILVTPVLEQGATSVDGVFPGIMDGSECYYDWYTKALVPVPEKANTTIPAELSHIPVYVRGGAIIPTQQYALTTRDARRTPWSLLVALDVTGSATGSLYLDDGVSIEPNATKMVTLSASARRLSATVVGEYADGNPLSNITIMGVMNAPSNPVVLGEKPVKSGVYDAEAKTYVISGLENIMEGGAWAGDWELSY